ncbi:MAG TPA: hypothetical protein VHR15_18435, partial [Ktedonobacterales bacterium]|nr:hypothetical protein [Ktedonobacterales bacterium]
LEGLHVESHERGIPFDHVWDVPGAIHRRAMVALYLIQTPLRLPAMPILAAIIFLARHKPLQRHHRDSAVASQVMLW